jgi:hypothetical protein
MVILGKFVYLLGDDRRSNHGRSNRRRRPIPTNRRVVLQLRQMQQTEESAERRPRSRFGFHAVFSDQDFFLPMELH